MRGRGHRAAAGPPRDARAGPRPATGRPRHPVHPRAATRRGRAADPVGAARRAGRGGHPRPARQHLPLPLPRRRRVGDGGCTPGRRSRRALRAAADGARPAAGERRPTGRCRGAVRDEGRAAARRPGRAGHRGRDPRQARPDAGAGAGHDRRRRRAVHGGAGGGRPRHPPGPRDRGAGLPVRGRAPGRTLQLVLRAGRHRGRDPDQRGRGQRLGGRAERPVRGAGPALARPRTRRRAGPGRPGAGRARSHGRIRRPGARLPGRGRVPAGPGGARLGAGRRRGVFQGPDHRARHHRRPARRRTARRRRRRGRGR